MNQRETLRNAAGWGCAGLALVIVGLVLAIGGSPIARAAVTIGGALMVLALAVAAWELIARRD